MSRTTGAIFFSGQLGDRDAVHLRHLDVHDDDSGWSLRGVRGGAAIAGLADHVVAKLGKHLAQIEPDQRLVIGDQHAPRAGGAWDSLMGGVLYVLARHAQRATTAEITATVSTAREPDTRQSATGCTGPPRVGARGFEPPTTGTPYRCATGLRHAPTRAV